MSVCETVKKPICRITIVDLSIGNLVGPQMGNSQTVSSCRLNLQTNHDLAICDLAIQCFGVDAIESLDVRVHAATNFVTMMRRKMARNRSSNVDSTILISLAILRRMVFAVFSLSSEFRNFCRPCSCRRLGESMSSGVCSHFFYSWVHIDDLLWHKPV